MEENPGNPNGNNKQNKNTPRDPRANQTANNRSTNNRPTNNRYDMSDFESTRIMPAVKQDGVSDSGKNQQNGNLPPRSETLRPPRPHGTDIPRVNPDTRPPMQQPHNDRTQIIPKIPPQNENTANPQFQNITEINNTTRIMPRLTPDQIADNLNPTVEKVTFTGKIDKVQANVGNTAQRSGVRGKPPSRRKKKNSVEKVVYTDGTAPTVISNFMKAIIYIVFVIVMSGILAITTIIVGNDVFAFVKSDAQYTITIYDYNNSADIATMLHKYGIIKFPNIFRLYAYLRHYSDVYVGGTYTVSPSMNYDQIIYELKAANSTREEVSITIKEGMTVNDIIDEFVSRGMGTRAKFIDVIQNYDYDFWFMEGLTSDKLPLARTYRLEGYLFPDTYYFFTDSSEETIIYKMLDNFSVKITEDYRIKAASMNYTMDDIIKIASLIQTEAKYVEEYELVSSVFHNRLSNPSYETNGRLESDATIQYILPERKENLTASDLQNSSPYNTYQHAGLPPGAICNPSLNAISFALEPAETDYYYFVSYPGGKSLFARSLAAHQQNIAEIRGAS